MPIVAETMMVIMMKKITAHKYQRKYQNTKSTLWHHLHTNMTRFKSTNFSHLNLWHYSTKFHHICTRCRGTICAIHLLIHIAIFQSVFKMPGCWMKVISPILPKIGCHGSVPWRIGKTGPDWQQSHKYLIFGEKIVKIGPLNLEIAFAQFKKERNYGR